MYHSFISINVTNSQVLSLSFINLKRVLNKNEQILNKSQKENGSQ